MKSERKQEAELCNALFGTEVAGFSGPVPLCKLGRGVSSGQLQLHRCTGLGNEVYVGL